MKAVFLVFKNTFFRNKILFLLILASVFSSNMSQAKEDGYILGIFPYLPPRQIEKIYAPIAEDFSKLLGKPVSLESRRTYRDFTDSLSNNEFDIVFLQPFDFAWAADKLEYKALATRRSMLTAIVVTLPDSPLQSLKDLQGKKLASTDRSAAVSYLMRDELTKLGYQIGSDVKIEYHRSHVSCLQQVLIRRADACITAAPALHFFEHKHKRKLRIIGESSEIASSLFAADSDVPDIEKAELSAHIVNWPNNPEGKRLLSNGRMEPFRSVTSKDYDSVREIAKKFK